MASTDDLVHCPICLEIYDQPRALPCLHTFCDTCIQEYIDTAVRRTSILTEDENFSESCTDEEQVLPMPHHPPPLHGPPPHWGPPGLWPPPPPHGHPPHFGPPGFGHPPHRPPPPHHGPHHRGRGCHRLPHGGPGGIFPHPHGPRHRHHHPGPRRGCPP